MPLKFIGLDQDRFISCRFDGHEREVGQIAQEMGFEHVSLSSAVMPMVRIVPRGYTGM